MNEAKEKPVNDDFASIDFEAISTQKLGGDDEGEKPGGEKPPDIDPYFAVYVLDLLITRVISIVGKFSGYEIKPNEIALTKTEINNLKPYAAKALEKFIMWIEVNPVAMFFFMLAVTYGSKTALYAKKVEKGKKTTVPRDQKPAPKPRVKSSTTAKKRMTRTNKIK